MKLRMQGSSVRLRLTRSEAERLHHHGEVSETARFRAGAALTYRVRKGADAVLAELSGGTISISVPAAAVEKWIASNDVGMYGQDGDLRIAVEKDFRCLTRPAGEEADNYPHPAERCPA